MHLEIPFSEQACRTGDSPISFFIQKAIETPGLISLAAGLVDEASLPTHEVAEAIAQIMANPASGRAALQYGSTQGLPSLRQRVLHDLCTADGMTASELRLSIQDVMITTGSQQLLYILGEALFNPGDIVIAEAPSYFVYHDCLKSHGVRVETVPMDSAGMMLPALRQLIDRLRVQGELKRVKLIYTVDYFQNPTGLSLSVARRRELVAICRELSHEIGQRVIILEDAAYRELRHEGDDLPSIKSFDHTNEYVAYASTFSKPCAPGLKTGYAIMPSELVAALCHLKGNHDFGSTNLAQHIIDRMIANGAYHTHVQRLREVYREKKEAMLEALTREFSDWPEVEWTEPSGGLYVWLTFPAHVNTGRSGPLVQKAVDAGVLYVPGEYGHVPDQIGYCPRNEIRLSFGVADKDAIQEGIRRLRSACRGLEASSHQRELIMTVK